MCSTNLGFSGTYGHCTWYQRALPRQLRGSPPRTRNNRADVRDNCGQRKRGCTCCLIVRVTAASKTEGVPAVSSIGFSGDNTSLGLSVGNELFSTFVPGIGRQTTVWYQVRTYNIGLHPTSQKKRLRACAQTVCASNLRFTEKNTNIRTYLVSARICTWYQPDTNVRIAETAYVPVWYQPYM